MNSETTIPLSCYIRTLNEADRVAPVIRAVRKIGAEVIVVDCGSTDATQEIARNAGARVIEKEWAGNGFQKRYGEEAATHDWLLDLDADEVLSNELQETLRKLFQDDAPEPGIFALKLVIVPPVPKGHVWHHSCLFWRNKLYHKSIVRMPNHAAWDQFKVPKSMRVKRLSGALYHYSFFCIEQQMRKMNNSSTVRANQTKLKPRWLLAIRILFAFPFYFCKKYVKHQMFRAGIYGFACAAVIASNRWLKDVKMYEKHLLKEGRNEISSDLD